MTQTDNDFAAHLAQHKSLEKAVERNSRVLFEKTNGNPPISVQIPLMRRDIAVLSEWMKKVNKTASSLIISIFVVAFGQFLSIAIIASIYFMRLVNDAYPGKFP